MVEFDHNGAILHCRGEEDRTTQALRRRALVRAMKAQSEVDVNLAELTFADSSLMLDLAALARRVRTRGGVLRLHGAQPQIRMLIELVGLHRLDGVQLEAPAQAAA